MLTERAGTKPFCPACLSCVPVALAVGEANHRAGQEGAR